MRRFVAIRRNRSHGFSARRPTRMRGLAFVNPALRVEAVGFAPWQGSWLGRDGDAVVHEPRARRRAILRSGQRSSPARSGRIGSPPAITTSWAPSTTGSATTRCARCSRRSSSTTTTRRRGSWRSLRATHCSIPRMPIRPRRLPDPSRGSRRTSTRRCRSARSCEDVSSEAAVTIEGKLAVRLECERRAVRRVTVRSTRPFVAARVLCGRAPDDAVAMVPRLLCRLRSRAASSRGRRARRRARRERSNERACGPRPRRAARDDPGIPASHPRRLAAGDGPCACDRAGGHRVSADHRGGARCARRPRPRASASSRAATSTASRRDAWLARMEGEAIDAWAEQGRTLPAVLLAELLRSSPALGRSDVPLMPTADRAALEKAVLPAMGAGSAFETAPVWDGVPVETGALARVHEHPAVAAVRSRCGNAVPSRMSARLVELALLLGKLDGSVRRRCATSARSRSALGKAVAAVQTARGLLLHRARIAAGQRRGVPDRRADRVELPPRRSARAWSRRDGCGRRGGARARGEARGAGARPLRRVHGRGGPCMRWRSPKA